MGHPLTQVSATEIIKILKDHGYVAYFAGGWVRDFLLDIPNDDIDIATDALPKEVHKIFPESILVGAHFGVVVVRYRGHHFEVTTFRSDIRYEDGRRPTHVLLKASLEEDAQRRDFTINGMFFDPLTNSVIDIVGGKDDLAKKCIRTIGNPEERFGEDKLRMIRAVRFAERFGFSIEEATRAAICAMAPKLLPAVSMERVWQEFEKMRKGKDFIDALLQMHDLKLLGTIFPPLAAVSRKELEKRLQGLDGASKHVPCILFLLHLFADSDRSFYEKLHYYLKTSIEQGRWIESWLTIKELLYKPNTLELKYEWAKAFADKRCDACLEVLLANMSKQGSLQLELERLRQDLFFHIEKFRTKSHLLRAHDLVKEGIEPSENMGKLLEESSRLAVVHDIRDPQELLQKLKASPLWGVP